MTTPPSKITIPTSSIENVPTPALPNNVPTPSITNTGRVAAKNNTSWTKWLQSKTNPLPGLKGGKRTTLNKHKKMRKSRKRKTSKC